MTLIRMIRAMPDPPVERFAQETSLGHEDPPLDSGQGAGHAARRPGRTSEATMAIVALPQRGDVSEGRRRARTRPLMPLTELTNQNARL